MSPQAIARARHAADVDDEIGHYLGLVLIQDLPQHHHHSAVRHRRGFRSRAAAETAVGGKLRLPVHVLPRLLGHGPRLPFIQSGVDERCQFLGHCFSWG